MTTAVQGKLVTAEQSRRQQRQSGCHYSGTSKGAVVSQPGRARASRLGKSTIPGLRSVSLVFSTFQSSRSNAGARGTAMGEHSGATGGPPMTAHIFDSEPKRS